MSGSLTDGGACHADLLLCGAGRRAHRPREPLLTAHGSMAMPKGLWSRLAWKWIVRSLVQTVT